MADEIPIDDPIVHDEIDLTAREIDRQGAEYVKAIARKQSSPRLSSIAANYLGHADENVRALAASVLSQDETKGQGQPVRPGVTTGEALVLDHSTGETFVNKVAEAPVISDTLSFGRTVDTAVKLNDVLQTVAETSAMPLDRQAQSPGLAEIADAIAEGVAKAKIEEVVQHPALARRQSVREPVVVEPKAAPGELRNGHENLRGPGVDQ